jgi:hypothetical protein
LIIFRKGQLTASQMVITYRETKEREREREIERERE